MQPRALTRLRESGVVPWDWITDETRALDATWTAATVAEQRVTRQVLGRRGTSRDPAWANRRRLLRARERLTPEQFNRMWEEVLAQEATGELLSRRQWQCGITVASESTPPTTSTPPGATISRPLLDIPEHGMSAAVVQPYARRLATWSGLH